MFESCHLDHVKGYLADNQWGSFSDFMHLHNICTTSIIKRFFFTIVYCCFLCVFQIVFIRH